MDMDIDFDIMGTRDILAPSDNWEAESDSENFVGEENKENEHNEQDEEDSGHLPPSNSRPTKSTSRQSSSTSSTYRLGPHRKVTAKDLDFEIYMDETAHEVPPFKRGYYGSNLPALAETHNGVKFKYALSHTIRRDYDRLMVNALEAGNENLAGYLWNTKQEQPGNLECLAGAYIWDVDCDPLDVWLWVQDKSYNRKWSLRQEQRLRDFLVWMRPLLESAAALVDSDPDEAMRLDEWNENLIKLQFRSLNLPNMRVKKLGMAQVAFIPRGEDENILYRANFTQLEQAYIDAEWRGPGRWAPEDQLVPRLESEDSDEDSEEESDEDSEEESDEESKEETSEEDSEEDSEESEEEEEAYEAEMTFEGDDLMAF
ncbi:hypothetical protein V8C42DRAFT_346382 [Trichoderma barbatum]